MSDEKNRFEIGRAGKVDGNQNLPPVVSLTTANILKMPLFAMAIFWMIFGQVLMVIITVAHPDNYLEAIVKFVSSIVPSVDSIKNANVFNRGLGRQHNALMWIFSVAMVAVSLACPSTPNEKTFLIRKPSSSIALSCSLIVLAILNASLDFYTGVYSFGLAMNIYGFSLLSSLESFVLPLSIRYLKLSLS